MLYQTTYRNVKVPTGTQSLDFDSQSYAPLRSVYERNHLKSLEVIAKDFQSRFQDVLICGTGGSSLGAKTLCALSKAPSARIHFMDNVDPDTFERLFVRLNPKTTGIVIVSKSGSTVETLMQTLTLKAVWGNAILSNVVMITEPTPNPLRKLGESWGVTILDHPQDIGGRFSCFSVVGLLPALISGVDVSALLEGAQKALEAHEADVSGPAFVASYCHLKLDKPNHVLMPYCDRLLPFAFWWKQLWAESLGKETKGFTPIESLGTVDQHSQLQLYLDGPQDKFFTIITTSQKGLGWKVEGIPLFEGKTMGDLIVAEQEATIETLASRGCPLRVVHLETLNETSLGSLLMHFMIETIVTADLLDVNAFDQPAVEHGKELTRQILAA
ncbi:Glucose-6-phosphate isomerase [Candidatus Bealeia paramacronuclearis]|uniref:Glucose-6-phosphate isomerase n=1 Tax=Candidatus Bealeia paramacronuclearis TaxID=1921001 RepID=A0ABZ2C2W3_9PROT|nr:Glucose-6-phosphate isomerase [Candidatus Bealeia paramacronuclearis]